MTEDQAGAIEKERTSLTVEQERRPGLCSVAAGEVLDQAEAAPDELSGVDPHPAELGTELPDRGRDVSLLEKLQQQLLDDEESIERLDHGQYGVCEVCREPIGAARLEALPATRRCLFHQEWAEREVGLAGVSGGTGGPVVDLRPPCSFRSPGRTR